jgi:hypothetical protein
MFNAQMIWHLTELSSETCPPVLKTELQLNTNYENTETLIRAYACTRPHMYTHVVYAMSVDSQFAEPAGVKVRSSSICT